MATTINSYSVKLGMDASGFIDSTKVSRSEARMLIKDIESARNPVERFAVEQDRLKRALDAGAISEGTYARLLKSKAPAIAGVGAALGPVTVAYTAFAASIAAASAATVAFIGHMRTVQGQIDDTADAAQRLGVSFTDLRSLQFGFQEGGGVDAGTVSESIKKLQINMAKAVEGDETTRAAFNKLGLDAGELMGRGPKQAILDIADAMQGVADHSERLKLSMEIFGKAGADLASTLGQGSDSLESSAEFAEKWLGLTEQQVAMVGSNNDAWDRVFIVVEGVTQLVAAELAPVMELVADALLGVSGNLEGADQFISAWVDGMVSFAGAVYDANELVTAIGSKLTAAASLDFEGMTKPISEAAKTFDTADNWLAQLESKRAAARQSAMDAEHRREEARHAMRMQETEKEAKARESAADKLAAEEERKRNAMEQEQRRNAETALKNAEKYYEDERKRQMKLREDVARGPGAGMEVGSAEAARFMAEQANALIAESTVKVDAKPSDEALLNEAKRQLEFLQQDAKSRDQQIGKLIDTVKEQGWEAV